MRVRLAILAILYAIAIAMFLSKDFNYNTSVLPFNMKNNSSKITVIGLHTVKSCMKVASYKLWAKNMGESARVYNNEGCTSLPVCIVKRRKSCIYKSFVFAISGKGERMSLFIEEK